MKTFLDSGVLLTAWRGLDAEAEAAIALIEDPRRIFYTSQLVKLEVLPKAAFFKQKDEIEFYQTYFQLAQHDESLSPALGQKADEIARKHGIAAMDALHLASAIRQGVEQFVTSEKPGKPLFRVKEISVVSLHSLR